MIIKLKDGEDCWVENPNHIRKLVDDHFLNVFKSGGPRDWGNLLEGIHSSVTVDMNLALMESVSMEEIKEAALQMGGFKAPGPDGFQGIFYRSFWDIVVEDVNNLVRSFLRDEISPTEINNTHIVLLPKIPNPESVSHFRPISLCNYSYKVLSKVLAIKLKILLPQIISPTQNAFVAGRQIQDNIGITHDVFHYLKGRKLKNKFELGIKVDMQKAYDRVEWDFLEATMEKMGFCSQWRKLIMGCVTSVKFAVILNGHPGNKFAPSRGLRQGDPLSPYLFLLIGEVLSRLIQAAVEKKSLDGIKLGITGPVLSHIFFADDMLIFLRANEKNCRNLVNLLKAFCAASVQEVNLQKSSVFFGANTSVRVSEELGSILGMPILDNPGSYLGVPACWGRSKKQGLAYVKGRIIEKLQGWKQCTLSKAGKEVLIKVVVQAVPAYPMNLFKFPAVGTHWQIMVGQDVRVWVDCWLPSIPSGRPFPLGEVVVTRNLRVSSLICPQSRDWDLSFLILFLSVADQGAIEGTPIGDISRSDRLIWAATKNGKYTVKSGYRWVQSRSLSARDHRLPHVRSIPEKLWNCIWKIDVQPKIRHFLWNSLHNILATNANLYRRRSTTSPTCPICLCDDESVEHLFLLCPWVQAVWFGGALSYRINRLAINSWISWLHAIVNPDIGNRSELLWTQRLVAYTCWHIWKAMCAFVFNKVRINLVNVVLAISNSVGSFLAVSCVSEVDRWFKTSCSGFVGVVLRDAEAHFIAAAHYHIRAPCAAAAEAMALLRGYELGASLGLSEVILESDSSEMISCLSNSIENDSWEAIPTLARVKLFGETFQNCRWSCVPRTANTAADALTSRDCAELCDVVWVDRPQSSLVFVLNNDGLPCPH
nr:uncharacterized protein LOC103414509 [Malus domestica]